MLREPELLLPKANAETEIPEVTIMVPALNEEITIEEFIDWCHAGLSNAGVTGEILIVDSSEDRTPELALAKGARVLRTPKRGLGQAYLDAIPYARGKYLILGDCDLTYDFRDLEPFIASFRRGSDFVMGSRFRGTIEKNSMPALHRYFGTPLTTWILNSIYGSKFSDIHCGMRGITLDALVRMGLTSKGWEYASEMVLKSVRLGLTSDEVPVSFYKDREGRLSHHKRSGFLSPWKAGWINLKVMLAFSPDLILKTPGWIIFLAGLIINFLSIPGSLEIGPIGLDFYSSVLGIVLGTFGLALIQIGVTSKTISAMSSGDGNAHLSRLTYNRGALAAIVLFSIGLTLAVIFALNYIYNQLQVVGESNYAVTGFAFMVWSVQIFSLTMLIELLRRSGLVRK